MKRCIPLFLLTAALAALLVAPAHALEYTINSPSDYLFGRYCNSGAYTLQNVKI